MHLYREGGKLDLTRKSNIVIENSTSKEKVPESVLNLAYRLMANDKIMKDIINELRVLFT